jgi:hypothetical protein
MACRAKALSLLAGAATIMATLTGPAHSEIGRNGRSYRDGPPVEEHPKVDEKAYKSALDRIPTPSQKYDPWGVTHPADPTKGVKKGN